MAAGWLGLKASVLATIEGIIAGVVGLGVDYNADHPAAPDQQAPAAFPVQFTAMGGTVPDSTTVSRGNRMNFGGRFTGIEVKQCDYRDGAGIIHGDHLGTLPGIQERKMRVGVGAKLCRALRSVAISSRSRPKTLGSPACSTKVALSWAKRL